MYKKRGRSCNYSYFSDNKGQVTVFIILGLILLLAVALIIVLQKEIITFERSELVPLERGPIENLVTSCLELVTSEALHLLGQQGGFIQLPPALAADASLHLKTSPFTAVPYWAYGETNAAPSLADLKLRLDRHIEQNLAPCVSGAPVFQETYDLVQRSAVAADTRIVDRKILFNVQWNIQVKDKAGEIVTELKQFSIESPVRLKAIRELAVKIIERELRELKLEDLAQDLLALDSANVPLFGTEFSCNKKRWRIDSVRQGIKDLLRVNLRELKVKGTEFIDFPDGLPYYENHYIWDLEQDAPVPDLSARFMFEDNYPFSFEVTPRSGKFLSSSQLGNNNPLISVLCLQTWKFVYNLDFPVVVEVTDETTGYSLKFGLTVHLKNNIPDRSEIATPRKTAYFDSYDDEQFCRNAIIPMAVRTYELIENQQTGVRDRHDLGGVDISYTCLKYSCDIGQTQYDYRGLGYAGFITNFPYCSGGILRGKKDNYKENFARVVSAANKEVELDLSPLKKILVNNVKVLKHTIGRSQALSAGQELDDAEVALITLKFRHNESLPPAHEVTFIKSPELDQQFTAEDTVALLAKADFTYELEISLLDGETILGGYKGKWLVPWEQLQNADGITFHALSQTGLSETEQFELFLELEQSSKLLPLPEIRS